MKLMVGGAFFKALLCIPCMQAMDFRDGQKIIATTAKSVDGLDRRFTEKTQILTTDLTQMSERLGAHEKQVENLSLFVGAQHKKYQEELRKLSWSSNGLERSSIAQGAAIRDMENCLALVQADQKALGYHFVGLDNKAEVLEEALTLQEKRVDKIEKDAESFIHMLAIAGAQRQADSDNLKELKALVRNEFVALEERQDEERKRRNKQWRTLQAWKTNVFARLIKAETERDLLRARLADREAAGSDDFVLVGAYEEEAA